MDALPVGAMVLTGAGHLYTKSDHPQYPWRGDGSERMVRECGPIRHVIFAPDPPVALDPQARTEHIADRLDLYARQITRSASGLGADIPPMAGDLRAAAAALRSIPALEAALDALLAAPDAYYEAHRNDDDTPWWQHLTAFERYMNAQPAVATVRAPREPATERGDEG
jgi:hypothetical protein